MDQLIFASLSHTHCWYEVGMLNVLATEEILWSTLPPDKVLRLTRNKSFLSEGPYCTLNVVE